MTSTNEATRKFSQQIEQAAFKLSAEGENPTVISAMKMALLDDWKHNLNEVVVATSSMDALRKDLAKPETSLEEGGSVIRYWGSHIWYEKPYPTVDEMIEDFSRGVKRYEVAMGQPIPEDWTWNHTPPDAFLARFPKQIYVKGNQIGRIRFWMSAEDEKFQANVLKAGQTISPPWYAHKAHVGYGDVSGSSVRGARVRIGSDEKRNLADYEFTCPSPKELYEYLEGGGTVKELIRERITLKEHLL